MSTLARSRNVRSSHVGNVFLEIGAGAERLTLPVRMATSTVGSRSKVAQKAQSSSFISGLMALRASGRLKSYDSGSPRLGDLNG